MTDPRLRCVIILLVGAGHLGGQQVADTEFEPTLSEAAFAFGSGPLILVDEGHNNFHTLSPTTIPDATHQGSLSVPGRLAAFRKLLSADGFRVEPLTEPFSASSLASASILMISNALADENVDDWGLPNLPAFEREEIDAVVRWVGAGGSLLLVADHQPWPAAAADLALELGFVFYNGYAGSRGRPTDRDQFTRADGTLSDHAIVRGRSRAESVASVMTFGGQAFRALPGSDIEPLLVFPRGSRMVLLADPFAPEPPFDQTITIPIDGMLQGAVRALGQGRVAVFGEAAMFSAQVTGLDRAPMGMNHPDATGNAQFVLSLFHWLAGVLPDQDR